MNGIFKQSSFYTFLLLFSVFLATSCKKKSEEIPPDVPVTSMDQLKIDPSFEFNTTNPVAIEVRMLDNTNAPVKGMRVDIYTDDPENGGRLMVCGLTDSDGYYRSNYRIPAYMKTVAVGTKAIGFTNMQTVTVSGGQVNCILGGKTTPQFFKSGGESFFKSTNSLYVPLGTYNSQGVPNYLQPVNDIIDASMINDINSTIPEGEDGPENHPELYATTNRANLVLNQACDIWVSFVHEGTSYTNSFGFYKFNSNNPPQTVANIDTVHIIFPNVSFNGSGGGLHQGNKVKIGTFPAGTEIGWVILADGFKNGTITNGKGKYYSNKNLNPETNSSYRQHAMLCNDLGRGKFLLGFEDRKRDGESDQDFNDNVFYITASPHQYIDPGNIPLPDYTEEDDDDDGVSDHFDDYPTNPDKSFNNYYPSITTNGTLAFEDLWPLKGDYDMNDVVIDYTFNQVTNGQNKVVSLSAAITLRAMGAGYRNGFGFQMPVSTDKIASVTGTHLTENYIQNNPNGTESGQTKATIIVFDNGYTVLEKPASDPYVGVNTSPGSTYVTPVTINVSIMFTEPIELSVLGLPPYNPFIIVNKTRGKEIHLVNKPPTDLADRSLFGTGDDYSVPGNNRYYATQNNLPWAFDIIDQFAYPYEKKAILQGYLKFAPWSSTSGAVHYDWFVPNPGYRNDNFIFQH